MKIVLKKLIESSYVPKLSDFTDKTLLKWQFKFKVGIINGDIGTYPYGDKDQLSNIVFRRFFWSHGIYDKLIPIKKMVFFLEGYGFNESNLFDIKTSIYNVTGQLREWTDEKYSGGLLIPFKNELIPSGNVLDISQFHTTLIIVRFDQIQGEVVDNFTTNDITWNIHFYLD